MHLSKWRTGFLVLGSVLFIAFSSTLVFAADAPPAVDVTKIWISIAILALAAILFLTEAIPLAMTSLMVPVLLVLFNVIPFKSAFAGFSDQWVLLFLMMFIVGESLFRVGVAGKIGKGIVSLAKNNEALLIVYVMIAGGIMSAFLNNTGTAACLLPIMLAIGKSSNISPRKLLLPMAFGVSLGGMLTLIGTPPNGIVQSVYEKATGNVFGFFDYAKPSLIIFVLGIIFMATIGRKILDGISKRPVSGKYAASVVDNTNITYRYNKAWIAIVVFALIIFFMFMDPLWANLFKGNPAVGAFFKGIPLVVYAMLGVIAIVSAGALKTNEAFKAVDWTTIFLFAGMLSLSKALEETGAATYIGNSIVSFTNHIPLSPALAALIGIVVVSVVLTNFMSNTATAALLAPIAVAIAINLGINAAPLLMGVGLGASACFLTPVATPPNTLVLGPGDYTFIDYIKVGWILQLITIVTLVILIPVFFKF
jgi:anion transporter